MRYLFLLPFYLLAQINITILDNRTVTVTPAEEPPSYASVYFVSPWGGGDTLTYADLQSTSLVSGDTVLFLKGYDYFGSWEVARDTCTGEWGRIFVGAYGSGTKPQINLLTDVTGWSTSGNWTQVNDTVWYIDASGLYGVYRLYLNGSLYMPANYYTGSVLRHTSSYGGLPATNEYYFTGIDSDQRFFYDVYGSQRLYVYSPSNPASYYSSMKIPGAPTASDDDVLIKIYDAKYLTFNDLEFSYGFRGTLISNSSHLIIDNCKFYGSQWHSVLAFWEGEIVRSDSVEIKNCEFNYGLDFARNADSILAGWQPFHDNGSGWLDSKGVSCNAATYNNGIGIMFQGNYWKIHNNTFHNYTLAAVEPIASPTAQCKYAEIYDNVFTNESQSGRAMNVGNSPYPDTVYNVKFYRNKVDGMRVNALQQYGDSVFYYFNLITNSLETNPQVYGGSGEVIRVGTNNAFFWWNTVVNSGKYGLYGWGYKADFHNNILINLGSHSSFDYSSFIEYSSGSNLKFYNNTFYAQGKNTSSTLFNIGGNYTISNFEAQLGEGADNLLQTSSASYLSALLYDAIDYAPQSGYTGEASVIKTEFMRWKIGPNFFDLNGNRITNSDGSWVTDIERGYLNEVR